VYVGVNVFSDVLEELNLPRPQLDKGRGGIAYMATAPVVRCWMRHYKEMHRKPKDEKCFDFHDLVFAQCMLVVIKDLAMYTIDNNINMQADWPEEGVPDGYVAYFV
jgi:hypothetical protein